VPLKAIVRPPSVNFAEGLTTVCLGAPDYLRALEQHDAYCSALEQCGLTLTRLAPDERYPDATFVEDAAVLTARCAILTRPGAPSRAGEVSKIRQILAQFYSELHSIREPGTLDGGDVCEAGGSPSHFFIGISERTNEDGARQLAQLLTEAAYSSSLVDIRKTRGILHLKSGLSYLGDNKLAVIQSLAEREEFRGYELIRVKASEEYAANCVRVNERLLVTAGHPVFASALHDFGYQTIALEMTEFQKMDGGLSCLSLRF
jgi:dimethylargininase